MARSVEEVGEGAWEVGEPDGAWLEEPPGDEDGG